MFFGSDEERAKDRQYEARRRVREEFNNKYPGHTYFEIFARAGGKLPKMGIELTLADVDPNNFPAAVREQIEDVRKVIESFGPPSAKSRVSTGTLRPTSDTRRGVAKEQGLGPDATTVEAARLIIGNDGLGHDSSSPGLDDQESHSSSSSSE